MFEYLFIIVLFKGKPFIEFIVDISKDIVDNEDNEDEDEDDL